jgi:hypothetical protein
MEEILLYQRFSYAKITPYKNYSKIPREVKPTSGIYKQLSYEDKYGGGTTTAYYDGDDGIGLAPMLDQVKKKNTRYFYWKDDNENIPVIKCASKHKIDGVTGVFYTTKDRHIKKYYNEPFSDILVVILERSIIRRGDKVTIKTNKYTKHRGFNCKYFRSNNYTTSVTFDMVKGDFLLVDGGKHGKTKSVPRFRKNSFNGLLNFIKSPDGPFKFLRYNMGKNNGLYKQLYYAFDDKQFNEALYLVFNRMITYPTDGPLFRDLFYDEVMRWFINTKKIKTPNEYRDLILRYYPTEKYLKKNDRKLVASILDVFQIKSKITIKLLHERPNIDLRSLIRLCYLFGNQYQKYIGSISVDMFGVMGSGMINEMASSSLKMMESTCSDYKNHGYDINDTEKENLLKLLLSEPERGNTVNENFMGLVVDHFRMLNRIREYDSNIRMRANSRIKFHNEHNELSKMISAIKKGWVTQYFYPEETIRQIQQPIKVFKSIDIGAGLKGTDMDDYISITPFVLTREEEYIEEGKFMHHCVASYAETDTSMIVSLRTEDEQDRVTCEFKISNGTLVQSRHFSNATPPKQFEHVIDVVSDLVRLHARFGTLNWLKKDRVPIKINGIEIAPEKREPRRLIDILDLDGADPLPF